MSDVKSLFRKKTKQAAKAKTEPVKPTAEEEEDDEWGVAPKPTEQLYLGNRKARELIGGAYADVNLAVKVAHDDTKAVFHDVRKKAVSAAASEASPAAPVEPSPPPAPEPAPTAQPGRWRSRRVLAEQGLIPPPLDSGSNSSSKENATATEAFPALSGFPSLGPARAAGPSPVVAAGRWGQVADTSSSRTTGQQIEKEGGVTSAPAGTASVGAKTESEGPLAAPPSASNAVLSTPNSQGKEKESTSVAPTVTGATESLNVQDSSVGVRQEKVEGNVAVDVIAEGVAAVDLKSKFGTKKKKKKPIDIDA